MSRTSFVWDEALAGNVAVGFNQDEEPYDFSPQSDAAAAYSAVTSINDFSTLLTAIMNDTLMRGDLNEAMITPQHRILTKRQFGPDEFVIEAGSTHEDIDLSYGLGWNVLRSPYGYGFIKEGNDQGLRHYSIAFENGTGLVLLSNSDNGDSIFSI